MIDVHFSRAYFRGFPQNYRVYLFLSVLYRFVGNLHEAIEKMD